MSDMMDPGPLSDPANAKQAPLTSNRKTVPDFFGRLYPNDLINGSFLGTWVRRAEVDVLLDDIERLTR